MTDKSPDCKLLPCPFCGANPQLRECEVPLWIVKCIECGAMASSETDVLEVAIEAWNKRSPAGGEGAVAVPVLWVRMLDGQVDWDEDCVSPDRGHVADSYDAEDGYSEVPLYLHPPSVAPLDEATMLQFMALLHSNIAEEERPMSRSDYSDDQWRRVETAFAWLARARLSSGGE